MASYSNSDNSYQTLRGYKHVWCYQRKPVLRRIKKRGLSEGIPAKACIMIVWHSIV